jgi:lipid A 3-O-deacylase
MLRITLIFCCLCCLNITQAQNYYSISFENDFLVAPLTDRNYTNGLRFEGMGPQHANKGFLLNKLLIRLKENGSTGHLYGSFFGQNLYTPIHLDSVNVQTKDRPYAAWLYAGVKCVSTDTLKHLRFTSEFYLGLMGPHAFGREVQTFIHKVVPSTIPLGWHHQIDSDLGFNYLFRVEKGFVQAARKKRHDRNWFELNGMAEANVLTVFNNAMVGGTIRVGSMVPAFTTYANSGEDIPKLRGSQKNQTITKACQLFLFARPQARAVFYNSFLQGGLLNRKSEHVIDKADVKRIYGQLDFGLGFTIRSFTFVYSQTIRSDEISFITRDHRWGAINLVFAY